MGAACVNCHNSHPESPKHDWKVGDVRGMQEVSITQPFAANLFSFKYLLTYFILVAATGLTFIVLQRRQALVISGMNRELGTANEFLASLSMKISRYLSPQIYKSIFSGQTDVTIHTERKKLTIFFSDIKDFTATTERLQPEQITRLLNEYFTEMSLIAFKHGGTVDKFVGDAMLIFFGDPETNGEAEDAKACLRMALDMQRRIAGLNVKWRNDGVEHPFRVRMGVNTGFCNVGNFGSADRMDYTIIGAEANLAARLQEIAEAGHVVISYETYALVRGILVAHPLPPITMKGISREVVPYVVEGMLNEAGARVEVFSEHTFRPRLLHRPDAARCADRGTHARRASPCARGAGTAQARHGADADLNDATRGAAMKEQTGFCRRRRQRPLRRAGRLPGAGGTACGRVPAPGLRAHAAATGRRRARRRMRRGRSLRGTGGDRRRRVAGSPAWTFPRRWSRRRGVPSPPRACAVELGTASIYELPFADGAFDAVRAERVFQHLDNPETALCARCCASRSPAGVSW